MAKAKSRKHNPKTPADNAPRAVREETVTTWKQAMDAMTRAQDTQGMVFFYRGQSVAKWDLKPSLLRLFSDLSLRGPAAMETEQNSLNEFKRRARLWLRAELLPRETATPLAWWPLMQHFSCPTRLLDWTQSPWVALYFACYHHFEDDSVVWSILPSPLQREQKRVFNKFVKNPFDPKLTDGVFVVEEPIPTERLEAQQGVFTVATSPMLEQEDFLPCLRRTVIKASLKQECLFHLRAMNITAASLFPGLDGLGRAVAEAMRLVAWTRSNHNNHMLEVVQKVQRSVGEFFAMKDSPVMGIHRPPTVPVPPGLCAPEPSKTGNRKKH